MEKLLPHPAPTPLIRYSFMPHLKPRCKVMIDKEAQETTVYVSFKLDRQGTITPAQYLEQIKDLAFQSVVSSRLFKLSRGTDPPFSSAGVGQEALTVSIMSNTLTATAIDGAVTCYYFAKWLLLSASNIIHSDL